MIKPILNKAFPKVLNPDNEKLKFKLIDKNSLKMQFFIGDNEIIKSVNHL